jgi:hypothetical protein
MGKRAIIGGGVAAAAAVIGVILVVVLSGHTEVTVRNDTRTWVRVASCVDDAADINSGDAFVAEGVPDHGALYCLVTPEAAGRSRCLTVPYAGKHLRLSELATVAPSRCH